MLHISNNYGAKIIYISIYYKHLNLINGAYEYTNGMNGEPAVLPIVFGVAFMLGVLIFTLGQRSSVKSSSLHNGGGTVKFTPYSCGEYLLHDIQSRINLERFLLYAIYFLIFDAAAFILAVSFNLLITAVIIYSLIILFSVLLMVKR